MILNLYMSGRQRNDIKRFHWQISLFWMNKYEVIYKVIPATTWEEKPDYHQVFVKIQFIYQNIQTSLTDFDLYNWTDLLKLR